MAASKIAIIVADSLTEGQTVIFFTNDNLRLYMFPDGHCNQSPERYSHHDDISIHHYDIPTLLNTDNDNDDNDYNAYSVRFVIDDNEKLALIDKICIYQVVETHPNNSRIYDNNFFYRESEEPILYWRNYLATAELVLPKIL